MAHYISHPEEHLVGTVEQRESHLLPHLLLINVLTDLTKILACFLIDFGFQDHFNVT